MKKKEMPLWCRCGSEMQAGCFQAAGHWTRWWTCAQRISAVRVLRVRHDLFLWDSVVRDWYPVSD